MEGLAQQVSMLRWKCRRGMLELDILLTRYLEQCFSDASEADQALFIELLKEEDPLLAKWLLKGLEPDQENYKPLINQIMACRAA